MNIFVLSLNVIKCAMFHCDQHVIKMILEYAELMCNAVVLSGGKAEYGVVLQNHPCSKWVCESLSNWKWVRSLLEALHSEYKFRYKKETNHKSFEVAMKLMQPNIEDKGITPFVQAMPNEFKDNDTVKAYRKYYVGAKFKFATWKNREIPKWYIKMRQDLGGNAIEEVKLLLDPENKKKIRQEAILANKIKREKRKLRENKTKSKIQQSKKVKKSSDFIEENEEIQPVFQIRTRNMAKILEKMEKKLPKRPVSPSNAEKKSFA